MAATIYHLPKLKVLSTEQYREIYFCGDVHGRADLLTTALANRKFSAKDDLLVLVGDLIDRGAYCPQVIDFVLEGLDKGYVAMVTGNHDHYPLGDYHYWMQNDGDWFDHIKAVDPIEADSILHKLQRLATEPLALELITGKARIGVVHGDVPENCWHRLQQLAKDNDTATTSTIEPRWQRTLLSGRSILKARQLNDLEQLRVANIDYVVSGHSVVKSPVFISNRAYIDTGAYYSNRLTVMSLPELLAGFNSVTRQSFI
ncbi:MAG: metallophosphoesterase [Alishewanella agri]|nr:metallophosphoesterase [Alishewanella agri]